MNYFVEGLQGSGKSTLVQRLAQRNPGFTAIREGDYSPVELAWCAYLDDKTYREILGRYPDLRREIEEKSVIEGNRRVVCYTKIKTENPSFYKDLERYEIYNNRISPADFQSVILSRFGAWKQDSMIFECSLFQNIVEDMILFQCASDEEIISFYRLLRNVLRNRDYQIIYIKTEDISGNLNTIRKERSDNEGNELWFPVMLGYFHESPYAKANGLAGEGDLIRHFRHRQDLELQICEEVFEDRYTVLSSKRYTEKDLEQPRDNETSGTLNKNRLVHHA